MDTITVKEHGLTFNGHPDDAKTLAEELRRLSVLSNTDLSTSLNDFCFGLETGYQSYYDLDEDNWERWG